MSDDGNIIEMNCPKCNAPIAFHSKDAGQKGKCPDCGARFTIPAHNSKSQVIPKIDTSDLSPSKQIPDSCCHPFTDRFSVEKPLDAFCPKCHKLLLFDSRDIGKNCICSACGHRFVVPESDSLARYFGEIKSRPQYTKQEIDDIFDEAFHTKHSQEKSNKDDSDTRSYHCYASLLFFPFAFLISFYSFRVLREFMLHYDYVVTDAQIVSWTERDYLKHKQHNSMFNHKSYDSKLTDVRKDYVFEVGGVVYHGSSSDTIEDCPRWTKGGNRQRIPDGYYSATKIRYNPYNPHCNTHKSFLSELGLCLLVICLSFLSFICGIHHAWLAIFKREFFKSPFIRKVLEFLP